VTPNQRAEINRLKKRNRVLERHRYSVTKAAIDRLIWLVHEIEAKPNSDRFTRVSLSAADGRFFRRIVDALLEPPK
jgi:hypothetical protein